MAQAAELVTVGVAEGVLVGVPVGVLVGELVGVPEGVLVGELVAVFEAVEVATGVAVMVGPAVGPVSLFGPQPFAARMIGLTNRNSVKRTFLSTICKTFFVLGNMNPLFFSRVCGRPAFPALLKTTTRNSDMEVS